MQQASIQPVCEVIILTALPIEYQAVLHYLENPQEIVHPSGTVYHHGRFRGEHQTWRVAVAEIGLGGPSAALETERAIQFFSASIALFVGVAGGLGDVRLGDVIAAAKIHAYEYGKDGATFEPRPEQWRPSYALLQRAQAEARTDAWLARLDNHRADATPRVFVGPTFCW